MYYLLGKKKKKAASTLKTVAEQCKAQSHKLHGMPEWRKNSSFTVWGQIKYFFFFFLRKIKGNLAVLTGKKTLATKPFGDNNINKSVPLTPHTLGSIFAVH